jgi:hypothetical protein
MIASSSYSNNIQIPVIAVKHSTGIKLLTAAGYTIDDTTAVPIDDAWDSIDDTEQTPVTVNMFSGSVTADTTDTNDDASSSSGSGTGDATAAVNSSAILGEYY